MPPTYQKHQRNVLRSWLFPKLTDNSIKSGPVIFSTSPTTKVFKSERKWQMARETHKQQQKWQQTFSESTKSASLTKVIPWRHYKIIAGTWDFTETAEQNKLYRRKYVLRPQMIHTRHQEQKVLSWRMTKKMRWTTSSSEIHGLEGSWVRGRVKEVKYIKSTLVMSTEKCMKSLNHIEHQKLILHCMLIRPEFKEKSPYMSKKTFLQKF